MSVPTRGSNLKLNPFEYGVAMAKSGLDFYEPYQNRERNKQYRDGFESIKGKQK